MKAIILYCLVILAAPAMAQKDIPKDKEQAKIETISTKSGVLIGKNFIDVGKIKSVAFQILEITDMATNAKTKGLRIETPETGSYATGTAVAFIDEDELAGLIKAIAKLKELSTTTVPENDVEYTFTSRTGFKAFLYNYKKKWNFGIKVDKYKSNSQPFWDGVDELVKFEEIINQASKAISL